LFIELFKDHQRSILDADRPLMRFASKKAYNEEIRKHIENILWCNHLKSLCCQIENGCLENLLCALVAYRQQNLEIQKASDVTRHWIYLC
jgi:hypothetical protein